jgi:hypothetical protein
MVGWRDRFKAAFRRQKRASPYDAGEDMGRLPMPAKSEKQRRFMGAELARKRAGKKTQTGISEKKLEEMASKKKG